MCPTAQKSEERLEEDGDIFDNHDHFTRLLERSEIECACHVLVALAHPWKIGPYVGFENHTAHSMPVELT